MPAIIIPSKWRTQPQYPVEIHWANPLTRDLIDAVTPIAYRNKYTALTAGQGVVPKFNARAWASDGSGIDYQTLSKNVTSPVASIMRFGNIFRGTNCEYGIGSAASDGKLSMAFTTGNNNRILMRAGDGATQLTLPFNANVTTASEGTPVVVIGTAASLTETHVYWNGVNDDGTPSGSTSGTPAWGYYSPNGLRRGGTSYIPQAGNYVLVAASWRRTLSAQEAASLSENPWQLFKPIVRRTYFYVAPSGGASITSVTPSSFDDAHAGIVVAGTGFGASQGSSTVTIGGITQTVTSWSDTSITITSETTGLSMGSATLTVTIV